MYALKRDAMRVLIVDDYPGVVELFDLALRARGIDVVGASTVGEAMSVAAAESFDAVVLDVELPEGYDSDGQELMAGWDFTQPPESAAAAYYNVVWRTLLELTFHDDLPESAFYMVGPIEDVVEKASSLETAAA